MSNDEMKRPDSEKGLRPYVKPCLSEVPLRMEEAVLGFCKTTGAGAGPLQSSCTSPVTCNTTGS
jgi:hypothetical protein